MSDALKRSILVIDDEKHIRDVIRVSLSRAGFEVAAAESGETGMEMIEDRHFDIILLDLMMPGMSGLSVLTRLKARHPHTVVIVITGYATIEHSIEAIKKGAFDFIAKPFSPKELDAVIAKAAEFIGALQDIREEKSRMGALISHISDGILATDASKNVVLANPAFLKTADRFEEDVIGRPASEVVSIDAVSEMIDEALSDDPEKNAFPAGEFNVGKKIFSVRCVPFRDRLDRNLGAIALTHDITAAREMDRMKSDFVSMVAHEIRSPLNSISMQLQTLMEGLAGDVNEKQKGVLKRARERIGALGDFTSDLLDLARIESGLIVQEKKSLDMGEVIEDQVAFFKASAQAKNIGLNFHPNAKKTGPLPQVLANRRGMEEVLSNLISNAIKYTPAGGEVTVSARRAGNNLRVSVTDNGFGIEEADMKKIFDKFFRVKNERARWITGSGLGLGIARSIVEAHNGKIEAASRPDEGSEFSFYIPLARNM